MGDFGTGWNVSLRNIRVETSGTLGKSWRQQLQPGFWPTYCLTQARPRFVTVTFPTGKVLKVEEMAKLLDSIDPSTPHGGRDCALFELMYSTGMQAGEIVALEVGDVDLDGRMVRIRHGKGGKQRVVPFGEVAALYWKITCAGSGQDCASSGGRRRRRCGCRTRAHRWGTARWGSICVAS